MLLSFLLPETVVRDNGASPEVELGTSRGKTLTITLGVTRIIEQESLEVSVWGSPDGKDWGTRPLATFPQKFYCGTYSLTLYLAEQPAVEYLRVQWKANRWGRGEPKPLFEFYVFAEEARASAACSST
jgi:hypothetical protein